MANTTTIPVRSTSLSLVPNCSMAHSLTHRGERSMTSLPTASIGETTSVIAATSMPKVTASAPATTPASAPAAGDGTDRL